MSNANPIPTPETLLHQVGRWLALHMGFNAAAPYVAAPGGGAVVFPRGVGFADLALGADVSGHEFFAREMVWFGALPVVEHRPPGGGTGSVWVGLTVEPVPAPAAGIDTPTRVIGVRLWCEALTRETAIEVLSDAARVLMLPGYAAGKRFVYNQPPGGMSADALAAVSGTMLGLIGVPPPATIPAGGSGGAAMWRVIGVSEFAPIQIVSDAIGAAGMSGMPGASGLVAASMTVAFTVVPAVIAPPSLAFRASCTVGAAPSADKDAALRVARANDGTVRCESGTLVGETHAYSNHAGATVGDVAASISALGNGWSVTSTVAAALARPAADLVLMDWRRARTTTGTGGVTVRASVYVHGNVDAGGGGGA